LVIFAVSLLVSRVSAVIGYTYSNAQCTGNAIAGFSVAADLCNSDDNSKIECNGTHVYDAIYSGPLCTGSFTIEDPIKVDTCINNTKAFCTGTFNTPNNVYKQTLFNEGSCGGSPTDSWSRLETCIPDSSLTSSTYYHYETVTKTLLETDYDTVDCTGIGSPSEGALGGNSFAYTSADQTLSGVIYWYYYLNTTACTGSPYRGQALVAGKCLSGTMAECTNGRLIYSFFENDNCTGQKASYFDQPDGECSNGIIGFCSGSMNVPANSRVTASFEGQNCNGVINSDFDVTDICYPNGPSSAKLTYEQGQIYQYYYTATTNCTGPSTNESFSFSSSFTSVSSSSTLIINKLILVLAVSLSLYAMFV